MNRIKVLYLIMLLFIASCGNEIEKITPPAERRAAAISDLRSELVAPANGWVLNYQPTSESGVFYFLLDFDEEGSVRIQSDVPGDNDYFFDQSIPYRIDTKLSLELIFETYGVFHYLFEQNSSSFGAEFEFYYVGKEGDNLMFASKSDNSGDQTVISMAPAAADASDVFSRELPEKMFAYDTISSLFIGPMQQIALIDKNVSIFWSINLDQRSISVRSVAEGLTTAEIDAADNTQLLTHNTGYGFFDGKLVLSEPLVFNFSGVDYTFSEMTLNTFTEDGEIFCSGGTTNSPVYTGTATGLGNVAMYKTLFDVKGAGFVPMTDHPYSVNIFYVADSTGISISQSGSIDELFPTANWFIFNYGFDDDNPADPLDPQPAYAIGIDMDTDTGDRLILREFVMTTTDENKVNVVPTANYWPNDITTEERDNLEIVVDEIFGASGSAVYAIDLPIESRPDLTVFAMYNACNNYEFLLVQ